MPGDKVLRLRGALVRTETRVSYNRLRQLVWCQRQHVVQEERGEGQPQSWIDPAHKFGQHTAEGSVSEGSWGKAYEHIPTGMAPRDHRSREVQRDTTFEAHYSIGDLAKQRRLGCETVRLLVKDEPGVLKIPSPSRGDSSCGHPRCRGTVAVTKRLPAGSR